MIFSVPFLTPAKNSVHLSILILAALSVTSAWQSLRLLYSSFLEIGNQSFCKKIVIPSNILSLSLSMAKNSVDSLVALDLITIVVSSV